MKIGVTTGQFIAQVARVGHRSGDGPDAAYFQAIPLYMRSDEAVSKYFSDHKETIDAITGTSLIIPLPVEVAAGDDHGVARIFAPGLPKRYPGLMHSDLPCFWIEDGKGAHEIVKLPDNLTELNAYLRAMTDASETTKSAREFKQYVNERLRIGAAERSPFLRALMTELPMSKNTEKLLAFAFGVIFVATILVIALFYPVPSPFQYLVFRIVLSLAAAGFVSMTPGFIELTFSNWLRAGGALAVFAIVFFLNPASLVTPPPSIDLSGGAATHGAPVPARAPDQNAPGAPK